MMSGDPSDRADVAARGTILIADDERSQRELLSGFLAGQGYRVREAVDGNEAVDRVREGDVDLVLLDQRMPLLGGIDAIRAIRKVDARIEIVVMTAYGSDDDAARAREAGAADYLAKPLDLKHLETVIHRALARRMTWLGN
jgi:CheY-like chemotaxis protein